jgi:hypothetical protein
VGSREQPIVRRNDPEEAKAADSQSCDDYGKYRMQTAELRLIAYYEVSVVRVCCYGEPYELWPKGGYQFKQLAYGRAVPKIID